MRGYFGVAIYHSKNPINVGTLFRTANLMGAKFFAVIGRRFKSQAMDTLKSHRHIPVFEYETFDQFYSLLPYDCRLIGVEIDDHSVNLRDFNHPERAVYLLGAEDHGLPETIRKRCHSLVCLDGRLSMNVSVAGSIVVYHRQALQ